jgi:hypothetical protein
MPGLKSGLADQFVNGRRSPTDLVRASHPTAVVNRVDSLWAPDHLNALIPRAIATPQYLGAAKLVPKIDASLEPWTMLEHPAARNRLGRPRLGVGVTDAGRRSPAVTAHAAATLASTDPRPGDTGHRDRGNRRQPTLPVRLDQTGGPLRRTTLQSSLRNGLAASTPLALILRGLRKL